MTERQMQAVPQLPHLFPPPFEAQQSQQFHQPAQVDPHSQWVDQQLLEDPLQSKPSWVRRVMLEPHSPLLQLRPLQIGDGPHGPFGS
jgi:hypothetical protein